MPDGRRVLFDAYWWSAGPPSGRNVLRSLVRTWVEDHPDDHLTLAVRPGAVDDVEREMRALRANASVRAVPAFARVHALAAMSAGRGAEAHDAVITQNFAARPRHGASCVFVHDAMFVEHPEWFGRRERAYLSAIRPSLRTADVILTSSQAEAARIARVWPETASRVEAIGLHPPRDLAGVAQRRPPLIGDAPYVLTVGRLNVRKNLARLIEAFQRNPLGTDHRLLIVGQQDGLSEALPRGDDRIVMLPDIDDAELRWLYRHAALFVFPSLDEGFGLPLVEARSAGARALVSDLPVFRELGLAEDYFDPTSVDDIARALAESRDRPASRVPEVRGTWSDTVDAMRAAALRADGERSTHVAAA